jgi:diguanylate cyclase (GGDEF)-like protein
MSAVSDGLKVRSNLKLGDFYTEIKKPTRRLLLALSAFILIAVAGLSWIQYQQVSQISRGTAQGHENFLWEFFQLELELMRYQDALRDAIEQPDSAALLLKASNTYNIFASQVMLFDAGTSHDVMQDSASFKQAMAESHRYLLATDSHLEIPPSSLARTTLLSLMQGIQSLKVSVHSLVLDAHKLQATRLSQMLADLRTYANYMGISLAFLFILAFCFGLTAVVQLALVGRRQRELESLHRVVSHRAAHDSLTNLVNRFEFEKHLSRMHDVSRAHGVEHAVMFVDLDRFKIVNDTCGHAAGDQLLREVVQVITQCVRSTDTFGRLGGDEFGVILSNCCKLKAAEVAEKIRQAVDDFRFEFDGRRFHIGASIGWVLVDRNWRNTAEILQAADSACYIAKHAGRNRVHAYQDDDSGVRALKDGVQWVHRLEEALDNGRFELHWQRIMPIQLGRAPVGIKGEVLLRMVSPEGRLISPGEFVPVAERFFLASRMDRWVLFAVFDWMLLHKTELANLDRLAINLSGQSLGDPVFRTDLLALMDRMPLDYRKVCFEVTETAAMTNLSESVPFFQELRRRGAYIALDDFGSGMTSYAYLKTLPADVLKIDGQFMRNLLTDPVDRICIQSMAQLAIVTQMQTVAEWVETPEVEDLLRQLGVDHVQGYLHHRPAPLDSLLGILNREPFPV